MTFRWPALAESQACRSPLTAPETGQLSINAGLSVEAQSLPFLLAGGLELGSRLHEGCRREPVLLSGRVGGSVAADWTRKDEHLQSSSFGGVRGPTEALIRSHAVVRAGDRMRVGLLTASISREGGGIFEAARALARSMHRPPEVEVQVFGLQDASSAMDMSAWSPIPVSLSTVRGPHSFGYSAGLGGALAGSGIDLVHVHGLWMYPSLAGRAWSARTRAPVVVSPHGMLDQWALENARWKKRVAAMLYERNNLRRAACLHALCEGELEAIRAFGLRNPVCVIPNGSHAKVGPAPPPPDWRASLPPNAKLLLYLGRVHPKKGLGNLLQAFAQSVGNGGGAKEAWRLVIAGWDQNGHRAKLEALAALTGIAGMVHFVGPQFGQAKESTFRAVDAFILPSLSEGLPMAVLEAWTNGLPVLMTPQCNLTEGFAAGAALRIEAEVGSLVAGLSELFAMSDDRRRAIGRRGAALARHRFAWSTAARNMEAVYRWLVGAGSSPGCVRLA